MATIESLQQTYVKSLRTDSEVPYIEVDSRGLVVGDREHMIVEVGTNNGVEPGLFLSQRNNPELTQIVPIASAVGGIILTAAGHENLIVPLAEDVDSNLIPVSVWGWNGRAVDQGNEPAGWLSEIVKRKVRFVALSEHSPRYIEDNPELGRVGFADSYPITVESDVSCGITDSQLMKMDIFDVQTTNRMRSTIRLSGLKVPKKIGELEFPEDYIDTIVVASSLGSLTLRKQKASARCSIPDTDHITGARKGRPVLRALRELGRHGRHLDMGRFGSDPEVFFNQNFTVELPKGMPAGGTIRIDRGAEVSVTYKDHVNWQPL